MDAFDAMRREHAAMSAEAYNDDHFYKQKLNQVRVLKRRTERKEGMMCSMCRGPYIQNHFRSDSCHALMHWMTIHKIFSFDLSIRFPVPYPTIVIPRRSWTRKSASRRSRRPSFSTCECIHVLHVPFMSINSHTSKYAERLMMYV
jgi:hypothetical protein